MSANTFKQFSDFFWANSLAHNTLQWAFNAGQRAADFSCIFAAGYRSALQVLIPALPMGAWAAMCVSEAQGNHPRNIACQLQDGLLSGEKTYISMAEMAQELLVLCKTGEIEGRPQLKLVHVPASAPGVRIERLPPLGLLQHIPHGRCRFDGVAVAADQILPGDGYTDYNKAFRILEDMHIQAAVLGHVQTMVLRYSLPESMAERASLLMFALKGIFPEREQVYAHFALAEGERQLLALLQDYLACDLLPEDYRSELQADMKVLGIARKATAARLAKAWQDIRGAEST